jgi:cysteinyl-tRNA synthetase
MALDGCPAGPLETHLPEFLNGLCSDLNVSRAIAALNAASGAVSTDACPRRELESLLAMDSVLGVLGRNLPVCAQSSAKEAEFTGRVEGLLQARRQARVSKDWATSDRIREELASMGVVIKDGPGGTEWSRSSSAP